jgi:hypothetical protein
MSKITKSWIANIENDPSDPEGALLTFPTDFLESVGWHEGDAIIWKYNNDGTFTLTKKIQVGEQHHG